MSYPFRLTILLLLLAGLPLASLAAPRQPTPGFADGLNGGPDYWQVAGVRADGVLILRAGPSPRAKKAAEAANGTVLRNLGCRMAHGQRWCHVEQTETPFVRGWAQAYYLREHIGQK